MIIEIHDSITAGLNHLTDDENNALVGLALSRSRGYNFIIASKKILTSIISIKDLGKMSIATYRKIYTDQVRWNNLLKSFSFRVRIVSSNQKISTQYENNVEILQIPLKDLLFYKLDDRASLIAENLTDIDFYTRVSMSYLKHKNIVIGYSYNEINGGGDTTKEVVKKHYQSNNGVSLCILDSDFKTPWSTYGTTAQGVIDIIPNEPYARYITTKSREAENIIPTKVLDHFAKKNKVLKNNIDKIKMLIDDKNIDSSPTKFIDFKKGVRRQLIKTTCPDTNLFWGDAFKKAGLVKVCNQKTGCTSVKTCCCSLIDGLGTDLLKCTVKHLKENKLDFNDVDDYLKPEWVFLCESIIPYIVSPLRKSS